ncbi:nucleotidyltransferase [candidate division KSB1 bacterium]|nr:MAG: nucleotidyltransferase [candidate division KSB1 bacterium]
MKAVIMAGGFGTRLKPLTNNLPKPMVPIVNKPIMAHTIKLLKHHRFDQIVALLYYQPEKISTYFKDGSAFGVKIDYVKAEDDFGTAGSVKNAQELLDERFLVISGDVLTDFNLTDALRFHQEKGSIATILLTHVSNPLPFGVVITDNEGKIERFLEKPSWGQVFSDTVNTGIYLFEPEVLDYIPPKTEFDFSKDLFPLLMSKGKPLYGYVAKGYWQDIGGLKQYQSVNLDCLEEAVHVEIEGKKQDNAWIGENCIIGKNVIFDKQVVIGKNCIIKDNVFLSRSVIGDNCFIGENCEIRDSILWHHVKLGRSVKLLSDVIANDTRIGNEAYFEDNVFVSDHCVIGNRAVITANVRIWPRKDVEEGAVLSTSLIWGERWLRELFTNSRVTGIINAEVSPEFGAKLGAAFGAYLGKGNYVATSRDSSEAARMINRALICGFMSTGVNVGDLRTMPIPIVRYALRSGQEKGGVHVRQSPRDERLVDIICFDSDGRDLPVTKTKSIERLFMQGDFPRVSFQEVGKLDFPVRVMESYTESFLKHIDVSAIEKGKFKIVIDYSFGLSGQVLPAILGSLDCDVIALNAYPDARRSPRKWEDFRYSLLQLTNIVNSLKADVGFLIDAGAESLSVVDENGHYLNNELLLLLVTKLYLETFHPRRIAVPVTAPMAIDRLASTLGVEVVKTRDDHRSLIDAASSTSSHSKEVTSFVGGTRGGFIFPEFHFACDAMFAMAKIVELMALNKIHLGELARQIQPPLMDRKEVPCPWEAKGRVMRYLMEFSKNKQRELIDGVKIYYNESEWVLILPDKELPLVHIVAEAQNRKKVDSLLNEFEKKILRWIERD